MEKANAQIEASSTSAEPDESPMAGAHGQPNNRTSDLRRRRLLVVPVRVYHHMEHKMIHLIYDNDDGLLVEFSAEFDGNDLMSDKMPLGRLDIHITKAWSVDEDGFITEEYTTGKQLVMIERHVGVRGLKGMVEIAKGNQSCSERPQYRCEHPGATCQSTDAQPSR